MARRRGAWIAGISLLVVLGVGVLIAWLAGTGRLEVPEERAAHLERIEVDAELGPDLALQVRERVTYRFTGADDRPFTVGSRTFGVDDPDAVSGTVVSITAHDDEGRRLRTLVDTPELFEWDISPARSGTHTYELRYEVQGAVRVGADVVELYRQWVDDTTPAVGGWSATVRVPAGAGELRGWAHGPLDGTLEVSEDRIVAEVDGLPTGTFVETRLAVPVERLDVDPGSTELLPEILAEETVWADEANQRRQDARDAEDRRAAIDRALRYLIGPIIGLALVAFWLIWQRWGRDPEPPSDIGDYWREVPDDPPAVAAAFLGWRSVDADAYSATLLDLARRGHLRIEEVPVARRFRSDSVEHRFISTGRTPDELRPFERRALDWLFDEGPEIDQSALVRRNARRQREATEMWQRLRAEVLADLDARKYVERGKAVPIALHLGVIAVLVGTVVLAVVNESWIPAAAAGLTAVVLLPLTFLHLSRTEAGARRHAEWTGLRRYMADFSRLDEAPVGHVALWESYLVAAVALGVAEDLIAGLEVQFPELTRQGSGFAPWYVAAAGAPHGGIGHLGTFSSDAGRPAVSSFTPSSSGSGAGGGFSGGGGGGGGGGSFGAR